VGLLFISLAALVHIRDSFTFVLLSIAFGFGITSVHVAINSQAFHFLERTGTNLVTSAAGYWSAGALTTAIVSGALVGRVDLKTHIVFLSIGCVVVMYAIIAILKGVLLEANQHEERAYSVKEIFTGFRVDWPVTLGMGCAVYLEFAIGDWGTIFTKDRLHIDSGLSAIPYIVFTATMIFGRLFVHRLRDRYSLDFLVHRAALTAGISFGTCIIIATHLPASLKWWSYGLFIIGFFMAGLGSSFIGPSFFAAANRRSSLPSAVVIGQFGVANNIFMFIVKWLVAWTIQFTGSIALAFMIPTAMILSTVFFVRALKEDSKAV
jgi:MFS family permease